MKNNFQYDTQGKEPSGGTAKVPLEEQRKQAREHYEEVSSKAHHWSSFVARAIEAYNPAKPETGGGNGEQKMSAADFFDKYIRAQKDFILPAWAEGFAEKYAAHAAQFTASAPSGGISKDTLVNILQKLSDDDLVKIARWSISPGWMPDADKKAVVERQNRKITIKLFPGFYPSQCIISYGSDSERGFYVYNTNDDGCVTSSVFNWDKIIPFILQKSALPEGEVAQKEEPSQQQIDDEAYGLYPDDETGYRIASNLRSAFENGVEYYRLRTHPADQGKEEQK